MERYTTPDDELAVLLRRSGWLPNGKVIAAALEEYQAWHGLRVDGWAGPQTYTSLNAPRFCAYPDDFQPPQSLGGGINRWGKRELTIQVVGSLGTLADDVFRAGVSEAARLWSEVCDLEFSLVEQGGDLILDTGVIDGPGRTLAYFELPPSDGFAGRLKGRADDSERWNQTIPLVPVICHELGHGLGLGHTNAPRQLMNPTLSQIAKPQPAWDVPQVIARYGPPKTPPPSPAPSDGWSELVAGIRYRTPSRGGGVVELDFK